MDKLRINKNIFPSVGDYVIGKIIGNNEYIKFNILEYNIDGIISYSQIQKKVLKNIKIGQTCVAEVINSEQDKGIVDLSMLNCNENDKQRVIENYQKNKHVISIVYEVSIVTKTDIEKINEEINWGLCNDETTSYEYLRNASTEKDMLSHLKYSDELYNILQKHFKKESNKISKKIKIVCHSSVGVNGIINSLKKAEELGINVNFVSSPMYSLETNEGSELMEKALIVINEEISKYGGEMQVC